MAIARRGLTSELTGIYETNLVEALQEVAADWWPGYSLWCDLTFNVH